MYCFSRRGKINLRQEKKRNLKSLKQASEENQEKKMEIQVQITEEKMVQEAPRKKTKDLFAMLVASLDI